MRYCTRCCHITAGEDPLFCNHCGSSYDAKVCPARHVNPRTAEVCSECGSRDLSTPAPPLNALTASILKAVTYLPGVFLVLFSILLLAGFVNALAHDGRVQLQLLVLTLLVGIFWWIYSLLPPFLRRLFRWPWRRLRQGRRRRPEK